MPGHDIIVIGASAGGVETLKRLMHALPADLPASVFVVVHVSAQWPSSLAAILERAGNLPVVNPSDKDPIEQGHVYVAPSDLHLLLEEHMMRVVRGPKENRHRPAIDPLFRSAAWAYGPRVVGAVLSGTLDDGAAGLWAVKSCGGIAVVQDPADALFPGMPATAMMNVEVDYCLPLDKIAPLLSSLARQPVPAKQPPAPDKLKIETEFVTMDRDIQDMAALGKPAMWTCPACRGALWELQEGDLLRYRCHVGHAFSPDSLLADQSEAIEGALYSALRALEEKATTLRRLSQHMGQRLPQTEARYQIKAEQLDESAEILRQLLAGQKP